MPLCLLQSFMPTGIYVRSKATVKKMLGRVPWNKGKKGVQKHSEETRKKMSASRKGISATWLIGKKVSVATKKRMSEAHKRLKSGDRLPVLSGEMNRLWKGDGAGYTAKHDWMRRHFGTPKKCENCQTENSVRFEWAK